MPDFILKRNGEVINIITAEQSYIDSIAHEYDTIEERAPLVFAGGGGGGGDGRPSTWFASHVRSRLTLSEKVTWDNSTAPQLVTSKNELSNGVDENELVEILNLLVENNLISEESKNSILS